MRYIEQILQLLVVLLLQVLVVNNLHLFGLCHPYIYIIFLLGLPLQTPRWAEMLIGFALGLMMDTICTTYGIHIAACVLVAYLRPLIIRRMVQDPERIIGAVRSSHLGIENYVKLILILTVLHHLVVFLLDAWSWSAIGWTLLTTIISSFITILFVLGYDLLRR